MHDRLGGRTILHDPVGGRSFADERVEQTADAWVQMSTHIAGIQGESLFMITLIGLDGALEV